MINMIKLVMDKAYHSCYQLEIDSILVDELWLNALKNESIQERMKAIILNNCFSATGILDIWLEYLDPDHKYSTKVWLEAIYYYTVNLNFTHLIVNSEIDGLAEKAPVFLLLYRELFRINSKLNDTDFFSKFPLELLSENEINDLEDPKEYRIVCREFDHSFIMEMLTLNQELRGFSTAEHIAGVHYLATHIARQIKQKGIKVDLGLVSGAAALHDIGKFGCYPDEEYKVAYYHYYYSDLWFRERNLTYIRQIAVNHSTWDLELSYLPIESLVLIYSDFRVKGHSDPDWPFEMKFYNLTESFQVILEKLDNVDQEKELRYRKVYQKLKDFEVFLHANGINTSIVEDTKEAVEISNTYNWLGHGREIVESYKQLAVFFNIEAMHIFRHESSLKQFLNLARNQENPHDLRRSVHMLTQFSRYLTEGAKQLILDFLFEICLHTEQDIRKQAAESMGIIIANFDAPYSKYLPPSVLENPVKSSKSKTIKRFCEAFITLEDGTQLKTERLGNSLVIMLKEIAKKSRDLTQTVQLISELLTSSVVDESRVFLKVVPFLHISNINEDALLAFTHVIVEELSKEASPYYIDAVIALIHLLKSNSKEITQLAMYEASILEKSEELYKKLLKTKLKRGLNASVTYEPLTQGELTNLFIENSQSSTVASVKQLNLEILLVHVVQHESKTGFYAAIHCCNLLKNSLVMEVRLQAAKTISVLSNHLTEYENNEIAMELLRGLEIERYAFTKYIPQALGRLLSKLESIMLYELLDDLTHKLKTGSTPLRILILETVSHAYNSCVSMNKKNPSNQREQFMKRLLNMLLVGFVQREKAIHLAAFTALAVTLHDTHLSPLEFQGISFSQYAKKMLSLLQDNDVLIGGDSVNYAYGFSQLYKFITEYESSYKTMPFPDNKRIAYFQGSFDPISLGQKKVIEMISHDGFEVYLAIDSFSWNRRTQPALMRRQLIEMSLADVSNVYLMPRDFSTNFQSHLSISRLLALFKDKQVFLAIGEDLIVANEAYENLSSPLYDLPHLIISRGNLSQKKHVLLEKIKNTIKTYDVIHVIDEAEKITPDKIRRAIDRQWDISDLVDPLASDFINSNHIYRNEPQFKSSLERTHIGLFTHKELTDSLKNEIWDVFQVSIDKYEKRSAEKKYTTRMLVIRDQKQNELLALGSYRTISSEEIMKIDVDQTLRGKYVDMYEENTAVIDWIAATPSSVLDDYALAIQTELIVDAINQGYEYALFWPIDGVASRDIIESLRNMGFIEEHSSRLLVASLKKPMAFLLDAQSMFKEDFRKTLAIRQSIKDMRHHLMLTIVKCYPGSILLAFDRGMLYDRLVHLIGQLNPLDANQNLSRALCVPYGDLFKRWTLPHTITKALHTERVYDKSMRYFSVEASNNHLSVEEQVRLIAGFERPVILIDDLLDHGLRLQAIEKAFIKAGVEIDSIVVGVMSSRGKNRMQQKGYSVYAGFELPNMAEWFTESLLYPFIGGDAFGITQRLSYGALHSVNRILPFFPAAGHKLSFRKYCELSHRCLNNARTLLTILEKHYEAQYNRPLTAMRLSEVFVTPRVPHYGDYVNLDAQTICSEKLGEDIMRLEQVMALLKD